MKRHATRVTALAIALAAAVGVAACGDTRAPVATSTTTTTTTSPMPSCPSFGSTDAQIGSAAVTRSPAIALLHQVQVQATACVDEVAFLFMGGLPGWNVAYHDGPVTEDPSDLPVDVAGAAHLAITFQPASGVDMAAVEPITTYGGPSSLRAPPPSGVLEVRRIGDFEAVNSWVVGLAARRNFEVSVRGEQLVVRIASSESRDTRCGLDGSGISVGYPPSWYADLGGDRPCRYFGPDPFPVYPGTDASDWWVTVDEADASATDVVDRTVSGEADVTMTKIELAGVAATKIDVVENGSGMLPAGFAYRKYVLDVGARAVTVAGRPAPAGSRLDAIRAAVDTIAALVRVPATARA